MEKCPIRIIFRHPKQKFTLTSYRHHDSNSAESQMKQEKGKKFIYAIQDEML
jgi:hypothetical protein